MLGAPREKTASGLGRADSRGGSHGGHGGLGGRQQHHRAQQGARAEGHRLDRDGAGRHGPDGGHLQCRQRSPPEQHKFTVVVPKGAYSKVDATMSLIVDSKPFLNGDFIELLSPTGQSVGTDQQKPEMQVNVADPAPGTWTAVVCQFLPDDRSGGHAYNGSVVIATKKHKH